MINAVEGTDLVPSTCSQVYLKSPCCISGLMRDSLYCLSVSQCGMTFMQNIVQCGRKINNYLPM